MVPFCLFVVVRISSIYLSIYVWLPLPPCLSIYLSINIPRVLFPPPCTLQAISAHQVFLYVPTAVTCGTIDSVFSVVVILSINQSFNRSFVRSIYLSIDGPNIHIITFNNYPTNLCTARVRSATFGALAGISHVRQLRRIVIVEVLAQPCDDTRNIHLSTVQKHFRLAAAAVEEEEYSTAGTYRARSQRIGICDGSSIDRKSTRLNSSHT